MTWIRHELLCVPGLVRGATILLAGHFAGHTAWYAFSHAAHATGIDPQLVAGAATGPLSLPIALVIVIAGTKAEDKLRTKGGAR